MENKIQYKCDNCGASSFTVKENNVIECEYCHTRYKLKKNAPKAEFSMGGNKATFDFGDVGEKINEKFDDVKQKMSSKSASRQKIIFGVLSLIGGCVGAHDLLRGNIVGLVFSILFCWTGIPAIFGLYWGIKALCMTDEKWQELMDENEGCLISRL
ncbi:MAG: TM2 domain-containing protein [Christensenellales bacterium]